MYNLILTSTHSFWLCCVFGLSVQVLSISVPKHFLQGKFFRGDLMSWPKPFSKCGLTGRCKESVRSVSEIVNSKQKSRNLGQGYLSRHPPQYQVESEDAPTRRHPSSLFKTSALENSNALPCDVSLSPDCLSYPADSLESAMEKDRLRTVRNQGPLGLPPPPKIQVNIEGLGHEFMDKEPDMDVLGALWKFGYLRGDITRDYMRVVSSPQEAECLRISRIGRRNLLNTQWHYTVKDNNNRVLYSGYCLRHNMNVDPGYKIEIANRPFV